MCLATAACVPCGHPGLPHDLQAEVQAAAHALEAEVDARAAEGAAAQAASIQQEARALQVAHLVQVCGGQDAMNEACIGICVKRLQCCLLP